jgi:hypothetical protein
MIDTQSPIQTYGFVFKGVQNSGLAAIDLTQNSCFAINAILAAWFQFGEAETGSPPDFFNRLGPKPKSSSVAKAINIL